MRERIERQLLATGFKRSVLLLTEGPSRKALAERIKRANALGADLFLSIHHDSVPDKFLEKWEFEGVQRGFCDRFSGHSIFISYDNSDLPGSLLFARMLGSQLQKRGLKYTPHYTDRNMGHRQRLLVDPQTGVYRYDQLLVLRDTSMPAVLLEAGSIINREEELRMGSVEQQSLISAAVVDAVQSFCAARGARTPPKWRAATVRYRSRRKRRPPRRQYGQSSNADPSSWRRPPIADGRFDMRYNHSAKG